MAACTGEQSCSTAIPGCSSSARVVPTICFCAPTCRIGKVLFMSSNAPHGWWASMSMSSRERHASSKTPVLAAIVQRHAGLRVPGAWGPFEVGVHAIVSQSLDIAATRDGLATITRAHGTHISGLPHDLTRLFPSADTIAGADLAGLNLPRPIANAITAFASAVAADAVRLDGSVSLDELISSLVAIPGVDRNTAHQLALRLGYHDAFPQDPVLRRVLQQVAPSITALDAAGERWRPWRALAVTHLVAQTTTPAPWAENSTSQASPSTHPSGRKRSVTAAATPRCKRSRGW